MDFSAKSESGLKNFMHRHPLFRLLAANLVIGLALGLAVVAGLLAADAHHLRTLLLKDASGWIVLMLLAFGFALTFGSVLMGAAVMSLPARDDEDGPGSGHRVRPQPVPVRVLARRRQTDRA
jgi:hypothetical protein